MKDSYIFYTDKLNQEYKTTFDEIELYVQSQNIDESTLEERMGELLDIFLSAQEKGRPVTQITGNQLEKFCETFCSDFSMKNRIYHVADWFASIAKVLFFVSVLDVVFPEPDAAGGKGIWDAASSVNLSGYLIGILVAGGLALLTNMVIRRIMFKTKRVSMKVLKAASLAGAVIGFLVIFEMMSMEGIDLFDCPLWLLFAITCMYLLVYYLLCGKRNRRRKIRFSELVDVEVQNTLPREMEKKYNRAKRRYQKRGKGELSWEVFLDREEKDCDRTEKMRYFFYFFPLVACAAAVVGTFVADGFEGMADLAMFVAIILGVEYLFLLTLWKLVKSGVKQRRAWLREEREKIEQK